jgi:hypothetical protein
MSGRLGVGRSLVGVYAMRGVGTSLTWTLRLSEAASILGRLRASAAPDAAGKRSHGKGFGRRPC